MPIIEVGKARMNVRQWGRGDPILLVHGLGTSSDVWMHQIPVFAADYHVVAVDLRGFGRSPVPARPNTFTMDDIVSDIIGICQKLELEAIHYIGTSMGGFFGQLLVLRKPSLCKSLSLCFTASRVSIPPDVLQVRREALSRMTMDEYGALIASQALAQPADPLLSEWLAEMIARNSRENYLYFLEKVVNGFDSTERLPEIKIPTLVISGGEDRVIPPTSGAELSRLLPCSVYRELGGAGHIGYAEKATVFNRYVLSFLDQFKIVSGEPQANETV
jgi:3-oxoadipate enol-lactonase